ncbi:MULTISPECIES: DUF4229 domain-containing protein [Rhodococcus]|uniref:DUF4229 domain-containing protein n=1 Tax=Rhodococcus rhodochrous TaxID=1829 RepID=A0AA46WTK6_RHORH|nr:MULTISPECIES: DUF4229 domain-containing protein [Rhodococcus]AYA23566.1 DUF4229 domain-containing protein [Rhodococcus rhodochrous]MBF4480952.1 DUF4229 domain-containing protein [Rhodococcus rhodochrous]MCB8909725.1 DUF4229 domain-containing protein [Rhodococcus rhodochrous]MDC3727667.1 DUF4229 domain-containing protein [Rhodococcus sp. Rp3]MDJ0399860.1 DUF4229 domain-containing protein [Rhodococcus rhodochrous]
MVNDERRNEPSNTPSQRTPHSRDESATGRAGTGSLIRDVALYSAARLALVVALTLLILYVPRAFGVEIPLLVAALFAVLIALPVSLVLFASLRRRVNEGIAAVDERRRTERADLEKRMRGENGR